MAALVAYSLAVFSVVLTFVALFIYIGRMGAYRLTGRNDGEVTRDSVLLLLERARDKMIVYDDGDPVGDSLYSNDAVLSALWEKLKANPDFVVQCLFNCPVPVALLDKFSGNSQFEARTTGLGPNAPRDTHIKAIDGGRMAYLSQHEFGSTVRTYELVNCLSVAGWALKGVARREGIERHILHFNDLFQEADVAH